MLSQAYQGLKPLGFQNISMPAILVWWKMETV